MFNLEKLGELMPDSTTVHVKFIGRTDGLVHDLICRTGVSKYVTGGGLKFDPLKKNLLPVFAFDRDSRGRFIPKGYRSIPVENVISVKAKGVTYVKDLNHLLSVP